MNTWLQPLSERELLERQFVDHSIRLLFFEGQQEVSLVSGSREGDIPVEAIKCAPDFTRRVLKVLACQGAHGLSFDSIMIPKRVFVSFSGLQGLEASGDSCRLVFDQFIEPKCGIDCGRGFLFRLGAEIKRVWSDAEFHFGTGLPLAMPVERAARPACGLQSARLFPSEILRSKSHAAVRDETSTRGKSVGTKVSEAEYRLLDSRALALGQALSKWVGVAWRVC
jgi:hypothetical protein